MLQTDQILSIVKKVCQHGEPILIETSTPKCIQVTPADLLFLCRELRDHPSLFFDLLSCVTAIDNGPQANTLEVVYNLYSIPFNHHLAVKVVVDRENPAVESVSAIWKTADWHEREAFDMFGIVFNGHQDLRRILLPADWDGHPLRKDYKQQEYYRSIKVEY